MNAEPERQDVLLTIASVASELGVSVQTVRQWIQNGELGSHDLGSYRIVDRHQLDEFILTMAPSGTISIIEAANQLNVKPSTIRTLIRMQKLSVVMARGKHRVFTTSVDDYEQNRRIRGSR